MIGLFKNQIPFYCLKHNDTMYSRCYNKKQDFGDLSDLKTNNLELYNHFITILNMRCDMHIRHYILKNSLEDFIYFRKYTHEYVYTKAIDYDFHISNSIHFKFVITDSYEEKSNYIILNNIYNVDVDELELKYFKIKKSLLGGHQCERIEFIDANFMRCPFYRFAINSSNKIWSISINHDTMDQIIAHIRILQECLKEVKDYTDNNIHVDAFVNYIERILHPKIKRVGL